MHRIEGTYCHCEGHGMGSEGYLVIPEVREGEVRDVWLSPRPGSEKEGMFSSSQVQGVGSEGCLVIPKVKEVEGGHGS